MRRVDYVDGEGSFPVFSIDDFLNDCRSRLDPLRVFYWRLEFKRFYSFLVVFLKRFGLFVKVPRVWKNYGLYRVLWYSVDDFFIASLC